MLKGQSTLGTGDSYLSTDTSGTPGNATANTPAGRSAFAAAASAVVITNSLCKASSKVVPVLNQAAADATLTQIVRVSTANGSFTVNGNAVATATTLFDWILYP